MIAFKPCHNQRKYAEYFVMLHKGYKYLSNQSIILKSVDIFICRRLKYNEDF